MAKKSVKDEDIFRFTIKAVGRPRTERQIRQDVSDALNEAIKQYRSEFSGKKVYVEAEPEGAFTGLELGAIWLLKSFGAGVLGTAGGLVGKRIYKFFSTGLRKRNLDPGPATLLKRSGNEKDSKKKPKNGKKKP